MTALRALTLPERDLLDALARFPGGATLRELQRETMMALDDAQRAVEGLAFKLLCWDRPGGADGHRVWFISDLGSSISPLWYE